MRCYRLNHLQSSPILCFLIAMSVALGEPPASSLLKSVQPHSGEVCFSPDGQRMVIGGAYGVITIREVSTGKLLHTLRHQGVPGSPLWPESEINWTASAVFSPDGKTLSSTAGKSRVTLWDPNNGKMLFRLDSVASGYDLTFSPDSSRLIGIGINQRGFHQLSVWNVHTGKAIKGIMLPVAKGSDAPHHWIKARFATSGPMLLVDLQMGDKKRHFQVWNTHADVSGGVSEPVSIKVTPELDTGHLSPKGDVLLVRTFDQKSGNPATNSLYT